MAMFDLSWGFKTMDELCLEFSALGWPKRAEPPGCRTPALCQGPKIGRWLGNFWQFPWKSSKNVPKWSWDSRLASHSTKHDQTSGTVMIMWWLCHDYVMSSRGPQRPQPRCAWEKATGEGLQISCWRMDRPAEIISVHGFSAAGWDYEI